MRIRIGIRHRLATLVLLGALTSALSLIALVRVLSVTAAHRLERARALTSEELDRLAAGGAGEGANLVGMRAGRVGGAHGELPPLPWRHALAAATASAQPVSQERVGDSTLLMATRPLADGSTLWVGYLVQPPAWLETWQIIVAMLTMATALLVATAIFAVISFKRSAAALNRSLLALGEDLQSPIPQPPIRELADVADGIRALSRRLADSRAGEERMVRKLAQKERLAALGRLAAGVAHEVRNPLASIKLRLDLAAAGVQLPPAVEQALTAASSEISRLDRLVADLLTVAGRPVGPRRPTSLGELARARAGLLAPWAAERDVTVRVEGDARAAIDSDSLARALDNLLRNAVEASPPGAEVTARVEPGRLVVEDAGGGVADDRAAELFEPFFTTKPEGIGLGLAISRSIARAHGGDLTYARGAGTTRFVLALGEAAP